jgi:hypothetical protein
MLKMTFAIGLLATAGSYYLLDHATVPLESALQGVSIQHRAITLAHNPDMTPEEAADLVVEADS